MGSRMSPDDRKRLMRTSRVDFDLVRTRDIDPYSDQRLSWIDLGDRIWSKVRESPVRPAVPCGFGAASTASKPDPEEPFQIVHGQS